MGSAGTAQIRPRYEAGVVQAASGETKELAIRSSFAEAGKRIRFQNFGNSSYKSREMGEALRVLEKALLIHLVYPQTSPVLPLLPDVGKSPFLLCIFRGYCILAKKKLKQPIKS